MLDPQHLLEKTLHACKSHPHKSIAGLAQALGIRPGATRQSHSWKVRDAVHRIVDAMMTLEVIAAYLECAPEALLIHGKSLNKKGMLMGAERRLFRRILSLREEDREHLEALVERLAQG